jgi:hypothetical protein
MRGQTPLKGLAQRAAVGEMASSGYVCQVESQIVPSKETFSSEPLEGQDLIN